MTALAGRSRGLPAAGQIPRHELVAALTTAALPLAGFLLATIIGGQLIPRYVIHAVVGLAIVFGYTIERLTTGHGLIRTAVVVMMIAAGLHSLVWQKYVLNERSWIGEGKGEFALLRTLEARGPLPHPIVVPDVHVYWPLWFYGSPAVRDNLLFVWKYDAMVNAVIATESRRSYNAMDFQEFVGEDPTFYFYDAGRRTPLLAAFVERGVMLCDSGLLDTTDIYPRPGYLYKMHLRAKSAESAANRPPSEPAAGCVADPPQ